MVLFLSQDWHNIPGGRTAVPVFTGGAAPPAFKPAHSLLPVPGQAYGASTKKQLGVGLLFWYFKYSTNIQYKQISPNLHSGLLLDAWLFHLKVDRGCWVSLMTRLLWAPEWKEASHKNPLGAHYNSHYRMCIFNARWPFLILIPSPHPFLTFLHSNCFLFFIFIWLSYFPHFGLQC